MKLIFTLFGIADDSPGARTVSYVININKGNPYFNKVLKFPYPWDALEAVDNRQGWYPYNIKKL